MSVTSILLGGIYPERDVLTRLDHLVILVRDLDRAIRDYETLGFAVTPGGEHADGLTSNALIPFKDGSYLELVAFLDPDDPQDNVWGWRPFLSTGGGLIDYCAASDDLRVDVRRLEDPGFDVESPTGAGWRLPDGAEKLDWSSLMGSVSCSCGETEINQGHGRT